MSPTSPSPSRPWNEALVSQIMLNLRRIHTVPNQHDTIKTDGPQLVDVNTRYEGPDHSSSTASPESILPGYDARSVNNDDQERVTDASEPSTMTPHTEVPPPDWSPVSEVIQGRQGSIPLFDGGLTDHARASEHERPDEIRVDDEDSTEGQNDNDTCIVVQDEDDNCIVVEDDEGSPREEAEGGTEAAPTVVADPQGFEEYNEGTTDHSQVTPTSMATKSQIPARSQTSPKAAGSSTRHPSKVGQRSPLVSRQSGARRSPRLHRSSLPGQAMTAMTKVRRSQKAQYTSKDDPALGVLSKPRTW